jgi:predicted RNA binding protein YcfA (HicA-like mRNA interferase family)
LIAWQVSSYRSLNGEEVVRILEKFGFQAVRQSGSHKIMRRPGSGPSIPVPIHGKRTIPEGTLRSIIKLAELTRDVFFRAV